MLTQNLSSPWAKFVVPSRGSTYPRELVPCVEAAALLRNDRVGWETRPDAVDDKTLRGTIGRSDCVEAALVLDADAAVMPHEYGTCLASHIDGERDIVRCAERHNFRLPASSEVTGGPSAYGLGRSVLPGRRPARAGGVLSGAGGSSAGFAVRGRDGTATGALGDCTPEGLARSGAGSRS